VPRFWGYVFLVLAGTTTLTLYYVWFFLDSLVLEVDLLVIVALYAGADLSGGFAEPGLLVSIHAFLGAGRALGTVRCLKTAAQAGVTQSTVAAAVARQLVKNAADLSSFLIGVLLPWVLELGWGKNARQGGDLERRCWMICRNIVCGIGPLGVAGGGNDKDEKTDDPAFPEETAHRVPLRIHCTFQHLESRLRPRKIDDFELFSS
jgi:hypothetical protein